MAMNRETDIELARASIPAQLKMIEAVLLADPRNAAYAVQAAMGLYGYAIGFVEADDPARAVALYARAREHAFSALENKAGMTRTALLGDQAALETALAPVSTRTPSRPCSGQRRRGQSGSSFNSTSRRGWMNYRASSA